MPILQAKRIKDALEKAKNVGRVEEPLTVAGCELVLQNLQPQDFESILNDCEPYEDLEYANAYQANHIAHAIVELNGIDLRDVDYVEEEVPAGAFLVQIETPTEETAKAVVKKLREAELEAQVVPPDGSEVRVVKMERYQWIRDFVLPSWSREAWLVTWRKLMELIATSDEKAKEGIEFRIPDETAEEKYRRLLSELHQTAEDLPDEMVDNLLAENDLLRKSSQQELDAMDERLRAAAPAEAPQAAPQPVAPAQAPSAAQPVQEAPSAPQAPPEVVQQRMAQRQPMNQQATTVPTPPQDPAAAVRTAQKKAAVPDQIRQAAMQNSAHLGRGEAPTLGGDIHEPAIQGSTQPAPNPPPGATGIPTRGSRAAQIAALESQVNPDLMQEGMPQGARPMAPQPAQQVPPQASQDALPPQGGGIDGKSLMTIVEKPPVAGVNKKYRPRGR